jgi:hypothetical protein
MGISQDTADLHLDERLSITALAKLLEGENLPNDDSIIDEAIRSLITELEKRSQQETLEEIVSRIEHEKHLASSLTKAALSALKEHYENPIDNLHSSVAEHISRQVTSLLKPEYSEWLNEQGILIGINPGVVLAAIVYSDCTKRQPIKTKQFAGSCIDAPGPLIQDPNSINQESVTNRIIKEQGNFDLVNWSHPLVELFFHSSAGAAIVASELKGKISDEDIKRVVSAIQGHDSFNSGFGEAVLLPVLSANSQELLGIELKKDESFVAESSKTAEGFLVQIFDRMDGCSLPTIERYCNEAYIIAELNNDASVKSGNLPVTQAQLVAKAIESGIIKNVKWANESLEKINSGMMRVLFPNYYNAVVESPIYKDYVKEVESLAPLSAKFEIDPVTKEAYFISQNGSTKNKIKIENIEQLRDILQSPAATTATV